MDARFIFTFSDLMTVLLLSLLSLVVVGVSLVAFVDWLKQKITDFARKRREK